MNGELQYRFPFRTCFLFGDGVHAYVYVHRLLCTMHTLARVQCPMTASPFMQEHIDIAIQLNPNEANLYFFLGMWCFEVRKVD